MPREDRRIFLNNDELVHAIDEFRAAHSDFLPTGTISRVEVDRDHVIVEIDMKYVDSQHVLDFNVGYDTVTEVLIQFCVNRQIKLPLAAEKRASAEGEEVALNLSLGREESSLSREELSVGHEASPEPAQSWSRLKNR